MAEPPAVPEFSVVVPTHDRSDLLRAALASVLAQTVRNFEVIVVDDGGPEPIDQILFRYSASLELSLIRQSWKGPGGARNAGAATAQGDLLAFTDDDCQPAADWLSQIAAKHRQSPASLIGGCTINGLEQNPYATTSQMILEIAYAHYNRDPENARFFAANNIAIPAALFREIGGFDEGFRIASEDRELCDRWLHLGHRMSYAPRAIVVHRHDLSLRQFCRQHFSYGRGARQFHHVRNRRGSGSLGNEVRFHGRFLMLLRSPLSRLRPPAALLVLLLLVLWQFLNLGGYVFDLARGRLQAG